MQFVKKKTFASKKIRKFDWTSRVSFLFVQNFLNALQI